MTKLDEIKVKVETGFGISHENTVLLIRAVEQLAERYWDVRLAHEDPLDNDYNGCQVEQCAWCVVDPDVLELLERGTRAVD